jgi:hypothetical protein
MPTAFAAADTNSLCAIDFPVMAWIWCLMFRMIVFVAVIASPFGTIRWTQLVNTGASFAAAIRRNRDSPISRI